VFDGKKQGTNDRSIAKIQGRKEDTFHGNKSFQGRNKDPHFRGLTYGGVMNIERIIRGRKVRERNGRGSIVLLPSVGVCVRNNFSLVKSSEKKPMYSYRCGSI
jgi:hypothetical protein